MIGLVQKQTNCRRIFKIMYKEKERQNKNVTQAQFHTQFWYIQIEK